MTTNFFARYSKTLLFLLSWVLVPNAISNTIHRKELAISQEKGIKYYKVSNCLNEKGYPGLSENGYIVKECAPDTLFRWVEKIGLDKLNSRNSWGQIFDVPLYSAFSPLSSYPYGPVPIRLKVREGVRFKMFDDFDSTLPATMGGICNSQKALVRNTIFVKGSATRKPIGPLGKVAFWEYDFCSFDVFESISVFQPRAFKEMIREREYIERLVKKGDLKNNLVIYLHSEDGTPIPFMPKPTQPDEEIAVDDLRWDRDVLRERLKGVERRIKNQKPKLYFNPNLKLKISIEEQTKRHFSTKTPTYWNWQTAK